MRRISFLLSVVLAVLATSCGKPAESDVPAASELPTPTSSTIGVADEVPEPGAGSAAPDEMSEPESGAEGAGAGADGDDGRDSKTAGGPASKSLVLAAVEKSTTVADSVRMAMTMVVGGVPELAGGEASLGIEAAIADGGQSSMFSLDMSELVEVALAAPDVDPIEAQLMGAMFGQPLEVRTIGGTTYVSASLLSFFVPSDTAWIAFEGDQSVADFGMSDLTAAPADFVALLRGVDDDAEIVGTEVIDGVTTTHVHGNLSVLDAIAAAPESERAAVEEALAGLDPSDLVHMSIELFEIDVWIGEDGLVRRMVLAVDDLAAFDDSGETPDGAYLRVEFDFSDYGTPIVVEEPPAADVTFVDESSLGLEW